MKTQDIAKLRSLSEKVVSEVIGGEPGDSGVWSVGVIEAFNIMEQAQLGLVAGGEEGEMNEFAFEAGEEVFGNGVVVRIAFVRHGLEDAENLKLFTEITCGVLNASVRVENEPGFWPVSVVSHTQRFEGQLGVDAAAS